MSMIRPLSVTLAAVLIVVASVASAGELEINKKSLKYDGSSFFRYKAQQMELGKWGKKKNQVFGKHGIDPLGSFKPALKGNWKRTGVIKVREVKESDVNIKGSFEFPTALFDLKGDDFAKLVKQQKCKFRQVYVVDLKKLAAEINKNKRWFNDISKEKNPRVVDSIIVVQSCLLTEEIKARHNGKFKGLLKGSTLEFISDAAFDSSEEIKFPPKTNLGYTTVEPVFDKKQKKKRSRIVSWKSDQKGFN